MKRIIKILRLLVYPFIAIYNWVMRKQIVSIKKAEAKHFFSDTRNRDRFFAQMDRQRRKDAFKTIQ